MQQRPDQDHIDLALSIEAGVTDDQRALYMECMNDLPMSERTTNQELRDGCILTHHVYITCREE